MSRVLVTILVTSLATINACKGVPTASTPPTQPKEIPEAVEPIQELPEFLTRGFTVIEEGQQDPFGCVGKVLRENGDMIGSCVLIKPNAVLTAAHCLQDETTAFVQIGCDIIKIKKAIPHPFYQDCLNDIAVIILEQESTIAPAQLSNGLLDLTRLEPLRVVGYGGTVKKISNPRTFFYYGTVVESPSTLKFLPLDGTVWFGDSGGGVFEDSGKLCGIITSFAIYNHHLFENSATHIFLYDEWIRSLLKEG